MKYFGLIFFSCLSFAWGQEAFIITVSKSEVTMQAPLKWKEKIDISVKNDTGDVLFAQVKSKESILKQIVLQKDRTMSYTQSFNRKDPLFFVPLSPAMQVTELRVKGEEK